MEYSKKGSEFKIQSQDNNCALIFSENGVETLVSHCSLCNQKIYSIDFFRDHLRIEHNIGCDQLSEANDQDTDNQSDSFESLIECIRLEVLKLINKCG